MSVFALIVSVSLCLIGIYLLLLPSDFKKKIVKASNNLIRYFGILTVAVGVLIALSDMRANALFNAMKTIDFAFHERTPVDQNQPTDSVDSREKKQGKETVDSKLAESNEADGES
jgi:uncharacterized protein YjeT (DUF2065 family)